MNPNQHLADIMPSADWDQDSGKWTQLPKLPQERKHALTVGIMAELSKTLKISYEIITYESPSIFDLTGSSSIISIIMENKIKEKR